ncbi:protein YgfX [Pseudomonas sp. HR96]|uniref:protein YgfX n=1 Tax=Pseudomonas sp. HR96 TaxID=1027966 RepID=UPI002A75567B|nr:protein YgfX [Pseudomonas sp. HR96]WPP00880.1 protein YgfX [Pseudomonas sp. HR96]
MSNPSEERFEYHWQPSRRLLIAYAAGQGAALLALILLDIGSLVRGLAIIACCAHAAWVLPHRISLSHPAAWRGLRRDARGWHLYSPADGWQAVQLQPDSIAQPGFILLRLRRPGQWFSRSQCLLGDSLAADQHRRLRVLLRLSRARWAAAR